MVFVERASLGGLSYARLVRERLVTPLRFGLAAIHDVPPTPGLRATILAPDIPGRVIVTGLAGWWIWSGTGAFDSIAALAPRGSHVRPRVSERLPLEVRTVSPLPANTAHSGVKVASPQRCVADALEWEEVADPAALEAALAAHVTSYDDG